MTATEDAHQPTDKRLIRLPRHSDGRGHLCVAEFDDARLPFRPARAFWIWDVPAEATRGGHAHRTCHELLVAIGGSVRVRLTNHEGSTLYELNDATLGLHIPPMCWCELTSFEPQTVCLCLASHAYDSTGYINDKATFRQLVGK